MAITNRSDFQIYDEQFQGGWQESLTQYEKVFNEGSAGTINLVSDDMLGDYKKEAFFKTLGSAIATRQDITSNAAQTDTAMDQDEFISVKLFRKLIPITATRIAFKEIGADPSEFSFRVGKMYGEAMVREMLNTILSASRAAIVNQAANLNDVTGAVTKTITHQNLLRTIAKFGDNSDRIKAFVMHSSQWFDLQEAGLADGFETIATGILTSHYVPAFGRPIIVTDSPSLIATGDTPDSYFVLGLQDDAATVTKIGDVDALLDPVSGEEQLRMRLQGEYRYNIGLRGFKWDTTNGGANPSDGAIATGTNWDMAVTSAYDLSGVALKCQASA